MQRTKGPPGGTSDIARETIATEDLREQWRFIDTAIAELDERRLAILESRPKRLVIIDDGDWEATTEDPDWIAQWMAVEPSTCSAGVCGTTCAIGVTRSDKDGLQTQISYDTQRSHRAEERYNHPSELPTSLSIQYPLRNPRREALLRMLDHRANGSEAVSRGFASVVVLMGVSPIALSLSDFLHPNAPLVAIYPFA